MIILPIVSKGHAMDSPTMPDQPIPGTEGFGTRPAPPVAVLDGGQAITTVIENIRSGQFSMEAGELLARLVTAVVAQSGKGKLVMEIEVKAEDGDDWVTLGASAKASMPKVVFASVFYPDDSGRLSRNPNQGSFFN